MKLNTPRWWYTRDAGQGRVARTLLKPLSWIWAAATARRIARADPVDPGVPIISVGNLTVGGSGKTPVTREAIRLLHEAGINAHGLSRGYGGSLREPTQVNAAVHTAADVGDEPLMLALGGPTWIAHDRVAGARAAAAAGAQVLVLDDAHQNPTLKKTLSLIVVDGETRDDEWPFGDGSVFPSGPMREKLQRGLARADAVVILLPADAPGVDPRLMQAFGDLPIHVARLKPAAPPPKGPIVAFAGIAKPWKVERALDAAGAELIDFAPFPDHAAFRDGDLAFLADRAERAHARLVTTEKDWFRLTPEWRTRVISWPVKATFEDEAAFQRLLMGAVPSSPLHRRAGITPPGKPPRRASRTAPAPAR